MQPQETTKIPLREREKLKPSPWRKIFGIVSYSIWVALFLIGGAVYGMFGKNDAARAVLHAVVFNVKAEEVFKQDTMNILLLGCDEDLAPGGLKVLKQAGRADMIMVAHLDFKNKTITGISIPRDTRCQLPGQPSHKLNAYHNLAKPSEAKQKQEEAVEYLTGINIDRTIVLDYVAFQQLIDSVDKVTVMITDKMDYDDNAGMLHVHFKPGLKDLDGYDAMCYVRFRKDNGGDFKRTERQRQLLMAFKSKVIKKWQDLPGIIQQGVKVLGPDTFTNDEVAALAVFSKGVTQANIKMLRLPTTQGEGSFEELDKSGATKLLSANGFLTQDKQKEND